MGGRRCTPTAHLAQEGPSRKVVLFLLVETSYAYIIEEAGKKPCGDLLVIH